MTTTLPFGFPTHRHSAEFWEALGRAVATFGFLEETLAKAIFAFTGMREFPEAEANARFDAWVPELKKTLADTLPSLIKKYDRAVRDHGRASFVGFDELVDELRKVVDLRNVLCHASWKSPDPDGRSLPFFVKPTGEVFDTPVDVKFLRQTQLATADRARAVIETVVAMGWQFPGVKSSGIPLI